MSDLINKPQWSDSKDCPDFSAQPTQQKIATRKALLGDLTIRRALPTKERRMIGAWCFLDHFGRMELDEGHEFDVAPHPHIGLQTFTWILEGEILHCDSLGSRQLIKPGQVNLMTAGKGISHSEESVIPHSSLEGVQLWIALPDAVRHQDPAFIHYEHIPVITHEGLLIYVMAGELLGAKAPIEVFSPLAGFDIQAQHMTQTRLPLNPKFEYGILPLTDRVEIEGTALDMNTLLYLGCGRSELDIKLPEGARFVLIGGEPFTEEILMWWNFVARSKQEIRDATNAWNHGHEFGEVKGYEGKKSYKAPMM